jgi:hypothetical protein
VGRPRQLATSDFYRLIWTQVIVPSRDEGLFAEAFSGAWSDVDAYFLDRLNSSAIGFYELLGSDKAPDPILADEDLVFDFLELLFREGVSQPASITRNDHGGVQFDGPFRKLEGLKVFRERLAPVLARHDPPLDIRATGEIIERPAADIQPLVDEPIPDSVPAELRDPIEAAIDRFYRRGATEVDRKDAVRHLADVLEHQRSAIKIEMASKDEAALFEIANKFAIRHHDRAQRGAYNKGIWLEWIFHVYLATARALLRVQTRQEANDLLADETRQ